MFETIVIIPFMDLVIVTLPPFFQPCDLPFYFENKAASENQN